MSKIEKIEGLKILEDFGKLVIKDDGNMNILWLNNLKYIEYNRIKMS